MAYEFIAEGNANIILRREDGSLIRVSKKGLDPNSIAEYWNNFWKPRLGHYMGTIEVIRDPIHGPALLISEVGRRASGCEIVAEFKPKWLYQSPRAPTGAIRCRTCAVKSLRNQPLPWCSLGLREKDKESVDLFIARVAALGHEMGVRKLIMETTLLDEIADLQMALLDDICHCMSLRDCTILIEYSKNSSQHYRARLVDLDPKIWEEKSETWERIEMQLQDHYLRPSNVCVLSRHLPVATAEPSNTTRSTFSSSVV